jgi:hypothetical protein
VSTSFTTDWSDVFRRMDLKTKSAGCSAISYFSSMSKLRRITRGG